MSHEQNLAEAFDAQAARFERAPVQTDPAAIGRLIQDANFPEAGYVLDAGCGPGLVSKALLDAGFRVVGVDLSREMIERARARCSHKEDKAKFLQISVFDSSLDALAPFDGAISRYVLHHTIDPQGFVARQAALLRPGGVVVACDHATDTDSRRAALHQALEVARDKTHTRNLTSGGYVCNDTCFLCNDLRKSILPGLASAKMRTTGGHSLIVDSSFRAPMGPNRR